MGAEFIIKTTIHLCAGWLFRTSITKIDTYFLKIKPSKLPTWRRQKSSHQVGIKLLTLSECAPLLSLCSWIPLNAAAGSIDSQHALKERRVEILFVYWKLTLGQTAVTLTDVMTRFPFVPHKLMPGETPVSSGYILSFYSWCFIYWIKVKLVRRILLKIPIKTMEPNMIHWSCY